MPSWQRAAIAVACRRLHARGLIAGAEGNVSVRVDAHTVLITPSGADKSTIGAEDVVAVDLRNHPDGAIRHELVMGNTKGDGPERDSVRRASSEVQMHLTCYAERPDVQAVVHAHPPVATGMATAGQRLPADIHPELTAVVGPVALVPYARPGTSALSDSMRPWLGTHEVFMLSNHGVTAVGASLDEAMQRLESTEQVARIYLVARLLGGALPLPAGEVAALSALHPRFAEHFNQDQTG